MQALGQTGQSSALEARASPRARLARRRRFVKHRIKAQGSNQAHPTASAGMSEFNNAVGLIAKHGDGDVRQPAPHHPDHLACPLGDGLVSQSLIHKSIMRRFPKNAAGSGTERPFAS